MADERTQPGHRRPPTPGSAETDDGDGALGSRSSGGVPPLRDVARLERFIVIERLGAGGMGQVFSAYDPKLDRKVAVKVVHDPSSKSPVAVRRFKKEAQAMARVSHPNVVGVFETGEAEGHVFIVMEFVDGTSAAQWRRDAQRSTGECLRVYLQAAAGLLAAHRGGLIHRDFKPDNVLVGTDGRVRVADFGLARLAAGLATGDFSDTQNDAHEVTLPGDPHGPPGTAAAGVPSPSPARPTSQGSATTLDGRHGSSDEPKLTRAGAVLGTLGYMSPEQVRGAEATAQSDQFSFCVALYEALYGQLPFPATTYEKYSEQVLGGVARPPPPSSVPHIVEEAVMRGLQLAPEARFPSMEQLMIALHEGLGAELEPVMTRSEKVRLAMYGTTLVIGVVGINVVTVLLTKSRDGMIRPTVISAGFAAVCAVLRLRPPGFVRHLDRYRRALGFYLIAMLAMTVGRMVALRAGMQANDYYGLECIALSGLIAVEGLRVGWRHVALAVVPLLYVPLLWWLPQLRFVLYNLVLTGTYVASVLLHLRQGRLMPALGVERRSTSSGSGPRTT